MYIYIYIYIPFFSSPVASCGGVSQASNPRSGNARLKYGELGGRPMRPKHRVMPHARGPFPASPALGSRTFIREAHQEFMNSYTHILFTFVFDMHQIYDDTNPQDSCEQVRARTMQRLDTFCKWPETEDRPHANSKCFNKPIFTKAKEPFKKKHRKTNS